MPHVKVVEYGEPVGGTGSRKHNIWFEFSSNHHLMGCAVPSTSGWFDRFDQIGGMYPSLEALVEAMVVQEVGGELFQVVPIVYDSQEVET